MSCKLCKRAAEDSEGLCGYHLRARKALREGYRIWKDAYGGISWKEYLNRVKTARGTGRWVREVVSLEEGKSR
jgi:hypothetical protein